MSDNVVKFRRPEKAPQPPRPGRPRGQWPDWAPFVVLLAVAVIIYLLGRGAPPA